MGLPFFIESSRKARSFKVGDEWWPGQSVGDRRGLGARSDQRSLDPVKKVPASALKKSIKLTVVAKIAQTLRALEDYRPAGDFRKIDTFGWLYVKSTVSFLRTSS